MKKSKTLWFLIIFFTWAALKTAGSLYYYESVSDYALFSSIGFGWLFFIINMPIMLLEACTAFLLITKKAAAYLCGAIVAILACINRSIVTVISTLNIETAKSIYIVSREAKGATVNQDLVAFLFTVKGLIIACLVYIAFYALVFFYLHRVKNELINTST